MSDISKYILNCKYYSFTDNNHIYCETNTNNCDNTIITGLKHSLNWSKNNSVYFKILYDDYRYSNSSIKSYSFIFKCNYFR